MALNTFRFAREIGYQRTSTDPTAYLPRSCINANWPHKILLSVTIELLRQWFRTRPGNFQTEEEVIELISFMLQNRRFKSTDCTEDAVRFHFKNFRYPAFTQVISGMSKYETRDVQEPSTYDADHPIYDGFEIVIQAIRSGQLRNKEMSVQPFNMAGLIATLRYVLGIARDQHFRWLYEKGYGPTWRTVEDARKFDSYILEDVCDWTLFESDDGYNTKTPEGRTYCKKIFNVVGYQGELERTAAPLPWRKKTKRTKSI